MSIIIDQLRMFVGGTEDEQRAAAETLLEIVMGASPSRGWVLMQLAIIIVTMPAVRSWLIVPGYNWEKVITHYLAYRTYCV